MRNQESAQDRDRSRLRQQTRNRSSKIASAQHPTHRFGRHQPPASRIAPDQTLETPKQLGSINQPHSPTPRPARLAIPASHNKNTRSHLISYPPQPLVSIPRPSHATQQDIPSPEKISFERFLVSGIAFVECQARLSSLDRRARILAECREVSAWCGLPRNAEQPVVRRGPSAAHGS